MRSPGSLQAIKKKTETNKDHEVGPSKYMLKELLPHLIRLDEEQMTEKEIEAKRQGVSFLPPIVSHLAIHFFMLFSPSSYQIELLCSYFRVLTLYFRI